MVSALAGYGFDRDFRGHPGLLFAWDLLRILLLPVLERRVPRHRHPHSHPHFTLANIPTRLFGKCTNHSISNLSIVSEIVIQNNDFWRLPCGTNLQNLNA